jgi:hypothetical protein
MIDYVIQNHVQAKKKKMIILKQTISFSNAIVNKVQID